MYIPLFVLLASVVAQAKEDAVKGDAAKEDARPAGIPATATLLFNGEDLSGWHGLGHTDPYKLQAMSESERSALRQQGMEDMQNHWRVEQDQAEGGHGEIVNDGHGVYLTTNREFGDCEFWIDYKTVAKADSGIYLRGTPQVQIWDSTEAGGKWNSGADKGSGGLWNNSPGAEGKDPLVLADRPFGQWNRIHVLQVGARTTVWLNDQLVVDHAIMENYWDRQRPLPRRGPIQLQTHGGEIRWRNVYVQEIASEEANRILARHGADGFQEIFNGSDFQGWDGAVENYEIQDGAILCKPGQGGVLFTDQEFGDFVVRLDFKLPEGGNNGLAIRYPGHGNAAYDGMTELQVLDSEHPKYAELDPRQYHGSVYGMVPAARGYLRPTGQWNFQEATVRGSTIRVELNGTVILDVDLSQVNHFMDGSAHPGKGLTSGHFGFAGHHDPVAFRNIKIKSLSPEE
jgi:hypothetical protein